MFQITPYINDFQALNNPGTRLEKLVFFLPFLKQVFHPCNDMKLAELSSNSFERKKVNFSLKYVEGVRVYAYDLAP